MKETVRRKFTIMPINKGYSETGATIADGCKVTIKKGAVYGGLTTARGKKIPSYVYGPARRYTVSDIITHKGVKEALIKEINSWVAISYLTVV